MTEYWKRLVYIDAGQEIRITELFYPFLFSTFFYGLGFSLFGWWSGVNQSSLFICMNAIHAWVPIVWGVGAAVAVILAVILLVGRKWPFLGQYASMFGFLVWLFASWVYILNGFWLVLLTVALPNAFFWLYYYVAVKWYERRKNAGLIDAG